MLLVSLLYNLVLFSQFSLTLTPEPFPPRNRKYQQQEGDTGVRSYSYQRRAARQLRLSLYTKGERKKRRGYWHQPFRKLTTLCDFLSDCIGNKNKWERVCWDEAFESISQKGMLRDPCMVTPHTSELTLLASENDGSLTRKRLSKHEERHFVIILIGF